MREHSSAPASPPYSPGDENDAASRSWSAAMASSKRLPGSALRRRTHLRHTPPGSASSAGERRAGVPAEVLVGERHPHELRTLRSIIHSYGTALKMNTRPSSISTHHHRRKPKTSPP
jgi:hypothetical protein